MVAPRAGGGLLQPHAARAAAAQPHSIPPHISQTIAAPHLHAIATQTVANHACNKPCNAHHNVAKWRAAAGELDGAWTPIDHLKDIERTYEAAERKQGAPLPYKEVKLQMRIAMEHCDLGAPPCARTLAGLRDWAGCCVAHFAARLSACQRVHYVHMDLNAGAMNEQVCAALH